MTAAQRRGARNATKDLMQRSLPYHLLQNILTYYCDLPCFLIGAGDWKNWRTLVNQRPDRNSPMNYEGHRHWPGRIRYNERMLARVIRTGKPACESLHGLHGLFVPVECPGSRPGVLQVGVFLRDIPGEEDLRRQWRVLTGREPGSGDEGFLDYARAMAETPVLDQALVDALAEALKLFGAFLAGTLPPGTVTARLTELQITVFARRLWHRKWVEWQVLQPVFFRFHGDPKALVPWEVEELGIRRFPTTVLAAKGEGTGREWTDLLSAARFRRAAVAAARDLEETLAYPLGNYGALLLTSAESGLPHARQEAQIRERAALFKRRMADAVGGRVWVGMGCTDATGLRLGASYQEAVVALHLAVSRNEPLVLYSDLGPDGGALGETDLRRQSAALVRALTSPEGPFPEPLGGDFIRDVLIHTRGRPEATRRALMETVRRLLEALEARRSVSDVNFRALESEWTLKLETAVGLDEMVRRFSAAMDLLRHLLELPVSGDKYVRLRAAVEAVEASLTEPWTLPVAARRFGFSVTTFSREFARHAGRPFSEFLLDLRLEKAKVLLREHLPPRQVAEACGFKSANYFTQIFKRKVGRPPGRFGRQA